MKNADLTSRTKQVALTTPTGFLAFGFGSGLAPKAPGTFGTLAAIPLYLLMMGLSWPYYLLMLVVTFVAGVYICEQASKNLGVHDHGGIVWDEFVGFWLTMFLIPWHWQWLLLGFVLFRFFDIIKPFPIKWLDQHVKGGFGIMIDDVIAGLYAWLILYLIVSYY
ncbi:phosphatidylglycerophosphatase A [Marinicella sp. S1101]|uniref:phosphatidylglycerophosphatase A family protein n=1 Tax=Marinicella marina TaxID=2996016 RepID=UPI002260A928|nr:phosphatidylglycerophosphatase A [Marinicella marina]MCX7552400.1 phosphatidylglycerophosphatase A [Marinicella marina]MDJ1139275.1 phosphatidylglycerophosphatase A [Marinicella marina]